MSKPFYFTNSKTNDSIYFNANTSHPIQQSSQEYIYYKKYVSIHSEDRDITKYPDPSEFEIELPEDLLNVSALRLYDWTFPANYDTFSSINSNIKMTFTIKNPYNPNINNFANTLSQDIYTCLYNTRNKEYTIVIEEGFYNPQQMVTELTNKFNNEVTLRITNYFTQQSTDTNLSYETQQEYLQSLEQFNQSGGYNNFIVVYNNVSQKIWFGNICDSFTLTNETIANQNPLPDNLYCGFKNHLPDFSNWGLPGNLGFNRCNIDSISGSTIQGNSNPSTNMITPRFFYGDVNPGDNGFWLLPNTQLPGSQVWWVEATNKINLMGPSYMYMEIEGQNCIDETSPYYLSQFTIGTNNTNGIVNSSFAKIAIPTTPMSQWFDRDSAPYKYYLPPAERMRKFKFKLRYHNGLNVNFGVFNYSFILEFVLQTPQILRKMNASIYPSSIHPSIN